MKKFLPIILVGILCLGLCLGGGYFIFGSNESVKIGNDKKEIADKDTV